MADPIAKVLVAATAKGGAGQSTTIACLAVYWHKVGRKVALLDADPNRTLTRWHGKGAVLSEMTLRTEIDEHAIISTIGAADLVVIPAMTDEANVFEAARTFRIVESASQLTRRTIPAHTFLCRVKRSAVATHAREQLTALKTNPLTAQLSDRVLFQEATFHGASPTVLAPSSTAAAEVALLAREVEWLLRVRPSVRDVKPARRVELT